MKKLIYVVVVGVSTFLFITFTSPIFVQSKNQDTQVHENAEIKAKDSMVSSEKANENKDISQNNERIIPNVLLVNKSNKLSSEYVPENLKIPNVKFISYADPSVKKMESTAAHALEELFSEALKDEINLLAVSGYRPYRYQEGLYNNKVKSSGKIEADKYVAQPGASEHQTGLAMDVLSDEYSNLDSGFQNTIAYSWLKENSFKYGFVIRYTKEKENITKYSFEPWHLRYVGVEAATYMVKNNLALEEYVNKK